MTLSESIRAEIATVWVIFPSGDEICRCKPFEPKQTHLFHVNWNLQKRPDVDWFPERFSTSVTALWVVLTVPFQLSVCAPLLPHGAQTWTTMRSAGADSRLCGFAAPSALLTAQTQIKERSLRTVRFRNAFKTKNWIRKQSWKVSKKGWSLSQNNVQKYQPLHVAFCGEVRFIFCQKTNHCNHGVNSFPNVSSTTISIDEDICCTGHQSANALCLSTYFVPLLETQKAFTILECLQRWKKENRPAEGSLRYRLIRSAHRLRANEMRCDYLLRDGSMGLEVPRESITQTSSAGLHCVVWFVVSRSERRMCKC